MMTSLLAHGEDGPLMILLGIIAIIVVVICVNSSKRNAFEKTCYRVAAALGGTYEAGGVFDRPVIRFKIDGHLARIEFREGKDPYTSVQVGMHPPYPGTFKVLEEGLGQSILKMFGAQDLVIGDPAFDDRYVVKATPESLAFRIFSAERRKDVVASVRRIGSYSRPTIDLSGDTLDVRVRVSLTEADEILLVTRTARDFVGYLIPSASESGIEWVESREPAGGYCPVCGTVLTEPVVRCADCRMPHHEECWSYLGKCSIYACGGNQFSRRAA
jgi:hypothetical protein